jgi:hypothetical protein
MGEGSLGAPDAGAIICPFLLFRKYLKTFENIPWAARPDS